MSLRSLLSLFDLSPEVRSQFESLLEEHDRFRDEAAILRAVLDSMSDGVAAARTDGQFVIFNKAAEALLGTGAVDGGPDTWSDAFGVFRPDGTTRFPDRELPLALAVTGVESDNVEMFIRNARLPSGRFIRVSGRPWRNSTGSILGGVVVFHDVTELKRAWAALESANAELELRVEERTAELQSSQAQLFRAQKLESLGQLCGGIAHDFNNLLTAISGYSDLVLGRDRLEPEDREALEEIDRAGNRAAELTRQLLAFGRVQPNRRRAVDVNALVSGLDRLLRRLIGEAIDIKLSLDGGMPAAYIDPGQFEQIILNLAINARDAMGASGRLTIETASVQLTEHHEKRHFEAAPGNYVELAVSDTGCGMDAATESRIFEPFFTTKSADRGTGLGLSTVYGIVKQNHGDIWTYSEVGKGTTFKIYLPVASEVDETIAERITEAPPAKPGETVLVAEDEEVVRNLIRESLESYGYKVLTASDGDSALRVAESFPGPIHLLLTDSVMPRTSGHVVATRVRGSRPSIRVLYMSGYQERTLSLDGQIADSAPFLAKPFTPLTLGRKVREVLDGVAG